VKPETIKNCFAKAGFQVSVEANMEIIVFEKTEEWLFQYIDYLNVDEEVITFN